MMMIQDGPMPTGADKPLRISGDPYKVQVEIRRFLLDHRFFFVLFFFTTPKKYFVTHLRVLTQSFGNNDLKVLRCNRGDFVSPLRLRGSWFWR